MRPRLRAACVVLTLFSVLASAPPAPAASAPIVGSGSTWSAIAVDQWRADVARFGLQVEYSPVGSSQGRVDFAANQTDFGVSEIPFQPTEHVSRPYVYLPIVAGGTSLMYHLYTTGGQQVRNLNLSPKTAAGIFTGEVRYWDHAWIKADNPGLSLPHETIRPVVRSDGSGTSAQFSRYLGSLQPSLWHKISKQPFTSDWPQDLPGFVYQQGSDGVSNYVASQSLGKFSITYVEAGYALKKGFPVANLLNASGKYTQPSAKDVAIALTHATFYKDGTQNLDGVYRAPESEAYAMSSYSYMIAPTNGFDPAKGSTLGQFIRYFVCDGQNSAEQLGYSPLPPNLVQNAFDAMRQIPGSPAPPPLAQCNNPTIKGTGPIDYDNKTGEAETTTKQEEKQAALTTPGPTTASLAPGVVAAAPPDPAMILAAAEQMPSPSVFLQFLIAACVLAFLFGPLALRRRSTGPRRR